MTTAQTPPPNAFSRIANHLATLMHKVFILDILSKAKKQWGSIYLVYDDAAALPRHRNIMAGIAALHIDDVLQGNHPIPLGAPMVVYSTHDNDHKTAQLLQECHTDKIAMYRTTAFIRRLLARLNKDAGETPHFSNAPLLPMQSNRGLYLYEGTGIDTATSISPWFITLLLAMLMANAYFGGTFVPTDDLARHAKVIQYGYDYTRMYPYAYNPPFNPYLGFDMVIGTLHGILGNDSSLVFQLLPFLMLAAAMVRLTRPASPNIQSLAILVVFFFTWQRFQSGRPCILQTSILLLSLAYKDQIKGYAHFALGLLQASLYHLFFLYTVPMMLTGRKRFRDYALATICGLAWWTAYSRNHYATFLRQIATTMNPSGLVYNELNPIISINLLNYLLPLAPLAFFFRKDIKRTLVIGFFALTNQLRYMETIIPLAVSFLKYSNVRATSLSILIALSLVVYTFHPIPYKAVHIPPNSYVLTTGSAPMNAVLMGSEKVHVVPSYTVGWNDTPIIDAIITMHRGKMDCSIFTTHHFDYVVENTLSGPPACLELQSIQGAYRIWKVKTTDDTPHNT